MAHHPGLVDEESDRNAFESEDVVGVEHDGHVLHALPLKEERHAVAVLLGSEAEDE